MTPGVTAEFNRNILRVVNRIGDGDFDPLLFEHSAVYNRQHDRIEMYLVARQPHRVQLTGLGLDLEIEQGRSHPNGDQLQIRRSRVQSMLAASGFELDRWFTDPDQLFALALAQKK